MNWYDRRACRRLLDVRRSERLAYVCVGQDWKMCGEAHEKHVAKCVFHFIHLFKHFQVPHLLMYDCSCLVCNIRNAATERRDLLTIKRSTFLQQLADHINQRSHPAAYTVWHNMAAGNWFNMDTMTWDLTLSVFLLLWYSRAATFMAKIQYTCFSPCVCIHNCVALTFEYVPKQCSERMQDT